MVTVALDTSLDVRVAVTDGDRPLAVRGLADSRAHVEQLTPLLGDALHEAGDPTIDRVVVGIGPGPFTGLRVGIAAAQTLAFARSAELVCVCSLDVLAAQVVAAGIADAFTIATDARRGEWYHARYAASGERLGEPAAAAPEVIEGPVLGPLTEGPQHLDPVVLATGAFPAMPPQALYLRDPDAKVPTRRKSALVPGLVLPARRR